MLQRMPDGYKPNPKNREAERYVREQDLRRTRDRSRSPVAGFRDGRGARETSRERYTERYNARVRYNTTCIGPDESISFRDSREQSRGYRDYRAPQGARPRSPSPSRRPLSQSHGRLPPPPPPPVNVQPDSAKKPAAPKTSMAGGLQAELVKLAKDRFASQNSSSKLNELAGEPDEYPDKKRKHTDIVWEPPAKRTALDSSTATARATPPSTTILDRTMQEVAEFKQNLSLGYDSDGPAAYKSSPSVSDASGEEARRRRPHGDNGRSTANDDDEEEDLEYDSAPGGGKSRWHVDEDMDVDTTANGNGGARGGVTEDEEEEGQLGPEEGVATPGSSQQARSGSRNAEAAAPAGGDAEGGEGRSREPEELQAEIGASMMAGCRKVDSFDRVGKISEGTYGIVYKARDKVTNKLVALKKIKMENERDGFPLTSIREINILLSLKHDNIVNVNEVVIGEDINSIYMVMEHLDHDLKDILESKKRNNPFSSAEAKQLMLQLLSGVAYMHENWVIHRDLKTSNILYSGKGDLKICDFGLARQYGSPLREYTHRVVTLWYRAPELLLGQKLYSTAIDMWSVGCIMGELLTGEALFPGKDELDEMNKIFQGVGSPTELNWPDYRSLPNAAKISAPFSKGNLRDKIMKVPMGSPRFPVTEKGWDLLSKLLALDPKQRISAKEALAHPWFKDSPLPLAKELMPTFPARSVR